MDYLQQLEEKEKSSKLIYDGKVLHLYVDEVTLPDGQTAIREYCRHNGGVCVLPLCDNGDVLCVEQYRYAHRQLTLEIPAGKFDLSGDESPEAAAMRELSEETGAECSELIFLGKMYPSPALLSEVIYMYFARGLSFGKAHTDEDEFLSVKRIPLSRLHEMAISGELPDAKTQCAVMKVWEKCKV